MPEKIEILEDSKNVTVVTDVTLRRNVNKDNSESINSQNTGSTQVNEPKVVQNTGLDTPNNDIKQDSTLPETVTTVTSVTEDDRE